MKKQAVIVIILVIIASGCGIGFLLLSKGDLKTDEVIYNPTEKYSYFSYIPSSALKRSSIRILLYTHGSPQVDTYAEMENYVRDSEIPRVKPFCDQYGYALIIVVTPRLWGEYPNYTMNSQAMNRFVMFDNDFDEPSFEFYKRPDTEFNKIIENFKQVFSNASYKYDEKVYIGGFSNGGLQANRFSILHPNQIAATAIGAAGGYIYPLDSLNETELIYPVGISDVESIVGTNYNLNQFKSIPHLIFIGENDVNPENDPVGLGDFDAEYLDFINSNFGSNQLERAENYSIYLSSIGMNCQFDKYIGLGHEYNNEMIESMFEFFDQN